MALTTDDLNELDLAIASGELTVKIDGREVTYRSIDDLLKARRHVNALLNQQAGKVRNPLAGIVTRLNRRI
jgi:ribosomal protein S17E